MRPGHLGNTRSRTRNRHANREISEERRDPSVQYQRLRILIAGSAVAALLALPSIAAAATVANPLCPDNTALFNPDNGKDVVLPEGFTVSVFASGLNMPTGIAFLGDPRRFRVFVLESGHGLPSKCNEQGSFGSGPSDPNQHHPPPPPPLHKLTTKMR